MKQRHIAIVSENSYEWLVAFFAIVNGGNVAIPIDKELSGSDILLHLRKAESDVAFVSGRVKQAWDCEDVTILNFDFFWEFLERGKRLFEQGNLQFKEYIVEPQKPAAIFFTSGTTGESKGVMLSHKNMASDINFACRNFRLDGNTLAVLPFHHTFGLIAAVFMVLNYGKRVFINQSLKALNRNLQTVRPQTMFMVPMFIGSFYKNIETIVKKGGAAVDVFGGKLEYIICGGAPLDAKLVQEFRKWGITVLNGYGITECSPVVAVNRNHDWKDGSVGRVLDGCEVQIASDGEILVSGDHVMIGYYGEKEETEKALQNGWYHTGDLGYIDEEGFLFITGRKKNLIILPNGENVSPEELEGRLMRIPYVREALVCEMEGLNLLWAMRDAGYTGKPG